MSLCTNLRTRQVGHTVCHWFFSLVKMSWWSFHTYIHRCLTSGYFHGLLCVTSSILQFLTHVIMTSEDVECGAIDCFHVAFLPWQLMVTTVVVCFRRFFLFFIFFLLFCDFFFTVFTYGDFFLSSVLYFIYFFSFYCQNSHQLMMWLNEYCIIYV